MRAPFITLGVVPEAASSYLLPALIGYRHAIDLLFESGFIALSGIFLGVALGLSLAWVLYVSDDFGDTNGMPFAVPWLNLGIICGIAFVVSMFMTFLPARAASRVPVAEALRYE